MRYELTRDLETGNSLIDSQHRQLLKAVNDLMDACSQGRGREHMETALKFLISYVDRHFKDEEQLQAQAAYPGLSGHRQFHEGYKRQLGQVANEMRTQGATIAMLSKLNQVVGILINHIRMEDKKVAAHVKSRS